MKYSNNQLLQGGIVGTMTGSCLFYDIIGMHTFSPNETFSLFPRMLFLSLGEPYAN